MASIWWSHQRCERCGWAGTTRAHRLTVVSSALYVVSAGVLLALEAARVIDVRTLVWPLVPIAFVWYYVVPALIARSNACGACGQRMKLNLLAGRAHDSKRPGRPTTS